MSEAPRKHVVRRIVKAVCATPWMIHEPSMEAIVELLDLRQGGYNLTPDQIQLRIGGARQETASMQMVDGVAVIPIHGVMAPRMNMMMEISGGTSTQAVMRDIRQAMNDPAVSAIVLDIDSPGGAATGTQELAELVAMASEQKPVKAVATSMAASAAYWVATAADEFIVNPSAQIGSIGVFSVYTDTTRADENAGIKHTVIRSAPNKAVPSGYEPLDEKGRATMQESVNDVHRAFVGAVAENRGVGFEHVEANFGGGKTFMGKRAVALGMADRTGTLDEVIASLVSKGSAPARSVSKTGGMKMSANIKETLIARGLISADATDEQVEAAALKALGGGSEKVEVRFNAGEASGANAADILAAVKIAALPDDFDRLAFASSLIEAKADMPTAIKRLGEEAAKHNKPAGASDTSSVRVVSEGRDTTRAAARDALLIRANGGRWDEHTAKVRDTILEEQGRDKEITPGGKPAPGAMSDRRLHSLHGLAEICLRADGYSDNVIRRLTKNQLAQLALGTSNLADFGIYAASDGPAYNTTGLFSSVMLDVSNNSMRRGYMDDATTYEVWMKRGESLPDFRKKYQTLLGELADPQAIPENGEFQETTVQDEHESYRVEVWGSMFSISWQSIVNDNIGAFTDIPAKQGRSMRRKQNRLAYMVLKDNANLQDAGALFNATAQTTAGGHANLETGAGAPSVTTLNLLEKKMLKMTALTGAANADAHALNIKPKFIIVPPDLIATVDELLASTSYAVSNGNAGIVNRWHQRLTPVVEAELSAAFGGSDTAWYLATDPRDVDTIEYAFLQGLETPALEQQTSFTSLGRKYRIYQAFGVKAIDYRGLQKHAGA